jgi:branched-chain amino acid transport system substrate-binding protein
MNALKPLLGLVLAGALALTALQGAAAAQTIKIGVAGPITGPYAKFGEQLTRGANAAAAAINKAGGIDGHQIEIIPGDDACDPKQARAVANRLVNEGVYAVAGHFCSSSTIPASEVYDEANVLQITPASTNPKVTDRGLPAVFRVCGRDDQQGDVAGDFIAKHLKGKRIAVIHDKDTYGQGLADATKSRLHQLGIQEVLYEGITRGDKDFNSLVTKMKGLDVGVIYFGGLHTEAGLIARQSWEQGLKATFLSGDGIVTEEFPSIAGPATEGVLMSFGADPRKIPEATQAVKDFRAAGYEPEAYTLYAYAAVQVIADSIKANGLSKDGRKLAKYMKSHTFHTVMGNKEFDGKGDLKTSDYVIYRWHKTADGKYTYSEIEM